MSISTKHGRRPLVVLTVTAAAILLIGSTLGEAAFAAPGAPSGTRLSSAAHSTQGALTNLRNPTPVVGSYPGANPSPSATPYSPVNYPSAFLPIVMLLVPAETPVALTASPTSTPTVTPTATPTTTPTPAPPTVTPKPNPYPRPAA